MDDEWYRYLFGGDDLYDSEHNLSTCRIWFFIFQFEVLVGFDHNGWRHHHIPDRAIFEKALKEKTIAIIKKYPFLNGKLFLL